LKCVMLPMQRHQIDRWGTHKNVTGIEDRHRSSSRQNRANAEHLWNP
jgi:hypothetical protein